MGIVAGSAVLFVVGAVAAMGASPAPSAPTGADASSAPNVSTAPDASTAPQQVADPAPSGDPGTQPPPVPNGAKVPGRMGDHPPFGGPMRGAMGFRDITVTAIDGSNLSLKTDDGWTRTITATSDTTITKAGQTIALSDVQVGDEIRFAQTRNADGTFTITQIHVVMPTIGGQVTAVEGSTITVTLPGGTTATIHVSADTKITVDGVANATVSDIKVNSFVIAEGTQRSDGSLDAETLHNGSGARDGKGGPGHRDRHNGTPDAPNASPALSTSAG